MTDSVQKEIRDVDGNDLNGPVYRLEHLVANSRRAECLRLRERRTLHISQAFSGKLTNSGESDINTW